MENTRVAKFLLGTILKCDIVSLKQSSTEHTTKIKRSPSKTRKYKVDLEAPATLTLSHIDYSAVIRTKDGAEQEVLIEVQKTMNKGDIVRFRDYLATKYKHSKLQLITVYILGFNLDVESPAFVARPDCHDLWTDDIITTEDKFVNSLTHAAYFIQTLRIEASERTPLHKLLSIFEQKNFVNGGKYNKILKYTKMEPELKELVGVLQYVAGDEELQAELEKEQYNTQWLDDYFGERDRREAELALTIKENKEVLKVAKKDLKETKKDLKETKEDLKEAKEDLKEAKEDLKETKDVLKETQKALENTVRLLKQNGVPLQQIAESTGLSISQIKKIQ